LKTAYLVWSLLYGYLLVDDAYRVHEKLGALLSSNLNFTPMFGVSARNIGELCVYVVSGLLFLIPIGITYRSSDLDTKSNSRCFFLILGLQVFCGVCLDILSSAIKGSYLMQSIWCLLENGGEMFAVSIMLWFVFCFVTGERCRLEICGILEGRSSCKLVRYVRRFIYMT